MPQCIVQLSLDRPGCLQRFVQLGRRTLSVCMCVCLNTRFRLLNIRKFTVDGTCFDCFGWEILVLISEYMTNTNIVNGIRLYWYFVEASLVWRR